jgi:hypothetical protein
MIRERNNNEMTKTEPKEQKKRDRTKERGKWDGSLFGKHQPMPHGREALDNSSCHLKKKDNGY